MVKPQFKYTKPVCQITPTTPEGQQGTLDTILVKAFNSPAGEVDFTHSGFQFSDGVAAETWRRLASTMEPSILSRMAYAAQFAHIVDIAAGSTQTPPWYYIRLGVSAVCLFDHDGPTFEHDALTLLAQTWVNKVTLRQALDDKIKEERDFSPVRMLPETPKLKT